MPAIDTRPALLSPALFARATTTQIWRAFHRLVRAWRIERAAADQRWLERDALASLGEHMLKDVGASPWLMARTAERARYDLRGDINGA